MISEDNRLGEALFKAMAFHAIPPTPQNYTIWYNHAAKSIPPLSADLEKLIAEHTEFTDNISSELYQRYFAPGEHVDGIETDGHLQAVIEKLGRYLDDHGTDIGNFGNHLNRFSSAIGLSPSAEQIRALLSDLVRETGAMTQRNALLEKRVARIGGEIRELRENLQTVRKEAFTDALTGISNRKFFDARLSEAAREAVTENKALSLVIGDIDYFKHFNDRFGHQFGDQVLRLVAQSLANLVRGRDTAARFGGEEFAIILPRTNLDRAAIVTEQIRQAVVRQRLGGNRSPADYGNLTLSFGVAEYRFHEDLGELIARADAALYRAKQTGRNRVCTEKGIPSGNSRAPYAG